MFFNTINTIKTKNTVSGFNWVVVGDTAIIAKSMDGSNWSTATSKGGLTGYGSGVAYGKDGAGAGLWVAVSTGGSIIANSKDGDIWTKADSSGGLTSATSVAYGKDGAGAGLWVAVGFGGIISKSTDGNIWTRAGSTGGMSPGYRVVYGKDGTGAGLWVAVGDGTPIVKSTDGNTWTAVGNNGGFGQGRDVTYGKDNTGAGLWIAVGGGTSLIAKSYDGNIWTPAAGSGTNKGGITDNGRGVAYGKDGTGAGLWVAVGDGGLIAKSTDGNVWTPTAFVDGVNGKGGITGAGRGVAYGKDALGAGLWVAVGQGGVIAKSTDGNVWTPAATSADGSKGGITSPGLGVAFNEILYLRT